MVKAAGPCVTVKKTVVRRRSQHCQQRRVPDQLLQECIDNMLCRSTSTFKYGSFFSGMDSPAAALGRVFTSDARLQHLKLEHTFCVESNVAAQLCLMYNYNFKNVFPDVTTLSMDDLEFVHCFHWSPSCVPFSKAGTKTGTEHKDGDHFGYGLKYVNKWKPTMWTLEQVKNVTSYRHKDMWQRMVRGCRRAGGGMYHVWIWPANAQHYGLPQNRERIIMLGMNKKLLATLVKPMALTFPPPKARKMLSVESLLDGPGETEIPSSDVFVQNLTESLKQILKKGLDPTATCFVLDLGGSKPHWSRICPCLTATRCSARAYYVTKHFRFLTVNEMAKIQGFDVRRFKWPAVPQVSVRQQGLMIGNSIPVSMMQAAYCRLGEIF